MSFSEGKVARLQCLSCKQGLNVKTVQFSHLLSPNWSFRIYLTQLSPLKWSKTNNENTNTYLAQGQQPTHFPWVSFSRP